MIEINSTHNDIPLWFKTNLAKTKTKDEMIEILEKGGKMIDQRIEENKRTGWRKLIFGAIN